MDPATSSFCATLENFYDNINDGKNVPFAWKADPNQDVAPVPGVAPGQYLRSGWTFYSPEDASQIYLAHVAQSLWVELTQPVAWHLHSFSDSQLALILPTMFNEGTAANNGVGLYNITFSCGNATPGDPAKSFRFILGTDTNFRLGPSLIKDTVRETIFELFRWFRDHLCHASINDFTGRLNAYGYAGLPPIEKMFTRAINPDYPNLGLRYWSWNGCWSAAALAVWLMRTMNIPCSGQPTYIDDGPYPHHCGIDFPSERLFSAHTDNFYADFDLKDPTIEPSEIFEPDGDYETMKQKYLTAPVTGESRTKSYSQAFDRKGLQHPTHSWVDLYWGGQIWNTDRVGDRLIVDGFDPTDLPSLHAQYDSGLQAAIDAFKKQNPQYTSDSDAVVAYDAAWKTWDDNR
jgi:hypothetical protein